MLHGPLDFRAHFKHAPLSAIGKPINWTGQAYVSTGPVDLPALAHYMDFPIETFAGRIDNAIWIEFAQGRMKSASGELAGTNVSMRVRPTQPRLDVPVASFSWKVEVAESGDYTLQLNHLHAELGQPPLDDGTPLTRTLALTTLTAPLPQGVPAARPVDQRGRRPRRPGDPRRIQPRAAAIRGACSTSWCASIRAGWWRTT